MQMTPLAGMLLTIIPRSVDPLLSPEGDLSKLSAGLTLLASSSMRSTALSPTASVFADVPGCV